MCVRESERERGGAERERETGRLCVREVYYAKGAFAGVARVPEDPFRDMRLADLPHAIGSRALCGTNLVT